MAGEKCADGLKGLEDVIAEVFPKTPLKRCTTHLKRNIISDVRIGDKREVAEDLKQVFRAGAGAIQSGKLGTNGRHSATSGADITEPSSADETIAPTSCTSPI